MMCYHMFLMVGMINDVTYNRLKTRLDCLKRWTWIFVRHDYSSMEETFAFSVCS